MRILSFISLLLFTYTSNAQLAKMFEQEAFYQHFNGVVLVKKENNIIYEGCFGFDGSERKNTLETPFDIGSISKQFTAAAILQLVQNGMLNLKDPINKYLGELGSDRWKKVTAHHLLTHTSGVPSLYQTDQGLEVFFPQENPIDRKELISRFSQEKLLFIPGEEFSYSNSGYILLATLIEEISGMPYTEYLQNEIFHRYGLSSTTCRPPLNAAKPFYGYRADLLKEAPVYNISWLIGAGGIYSTASDLSHWIQVINKDDFLTKDLREDYFRRHTKAGGAHYAYGWLIDKQGHIQHDGGSAGFTSFVSFDPVSKEQVIILTNRGFEEIKLYGKSSEKISEWADNVWKSLEGTSIDVLPTVKNHKLSPKKFKMENGQAVQFIPEDSIYRVQTLSGLPSRLVSNTPIQPDNRHDSVLVGSATYLGKGKFWSIAKYCDAEMKFVSYFGLLSIGYKMIKSDLGDVEALIPYKIAESHGLIRIKGTKAEKDIIFYFDDEGKIQGIFEHGYYTKDHEQKMIAYPIGDNRFYLDGFPYGELSAIFTIENSSLQMEQLGRTIYGRSIAK